MADYCEWCNGEYIGQGRGVTYTQEIINSAINQYNRSNANGKAKIWAVMQRYNEWPKAGDRRGEFCSSRCQSQSVASGQFGKWQARSWHGLW